MIDVTSFLLSLLWLWSTRDKVWTPTFDGPREARFQRAVAYYQHTMRLDLQRRTDSYMLDVRRERLVINGERVCAWVARSADFEMDVIGFALDRRCNKWKPEYLALHEQCHRRMAHLDVYVENKHAEVKQCMEWYSAEERR